MLVCIGPRWLEAASVAGGRRLEEDDDWVRREIKIALQHGNHVIPLLLGGRHEVVIPAPSELPPDIAPLVSLQAFRLEPGGPLRIALPDLAERLSELVPALALPKRSAATLAVEQKIGTLAGKATVLRVSGELGSPADLTQDISVVTETGEAVGMDLLHPREGSD